MVIDKSKGKRKMEMEEQTGDIDSEDEEFGESGGRGGNDFEDVYRFEDGLLTEVNEDGPYEKGSDNEAEPTEGNEKELEAKILLAIEEGNKGDEDDEAMFGDVDSDEEAIGEEYNSDGDEVRYLEFNPKVDMENPWFCKGTLFATPEILRAAIMERAIQKGWEPLYNKSDISRLRVICKAEDCEFELFASRMQHSNTFQIKTYQGNHNCARVQENCVVKVPYLVRKFSNFIKMNPNITTGKVSCQQVYRTKVDALNQLELCMKEKYAKVQDYAQELRRVDPNTTVDIKCDFNNLEKQLVFKRMYICLGALKEVGLDANNTTYVVAYAMVEMESKDSWIWFLRLLEKDIKITGEGNGFTFISG
ncbi:hypothetical protein ACLB2K_006679 [Fragaria x ananassa]